MRTLAAIIRNRSFSSTGRVLLYLSIMPHIVKRLFWFTSASAASRYSPPWLSK